MTARGRARRLAENEALARDVNERVGEVASSWYGEGEPLEFVCECSLEDCSERVHLLMKDYRELRSSPHLFALVPDHLVPEIERAIREVGDALIVEKLGTGRDVAEETAD